MDNIHWIWDKNDSGRNRRVCFRKSFYTTAETVTLDITADARYELYVNGQFIGRGPIRYWEKQYPYDTYDISSYLISGINVIAVMVWEIGMSSFQYLKDTAGLLLRCCTDETLLFASDDTFKCIPNAGYDVDTLPTCCQQSFAEVYDARKMDPMWTRADFDDSLWENAVIIKKECDVFPRDIPFLTNEHMLPVRVMEHSVVKPPKATIDVFVRRAVTEDMYHVNSWVYQTYMCLRIDSETEQRGTIIFTGDSWQCPQGDIKVNGIFYEKNGNEIPVTLEKGSNLVIVRIEGKRHGFVSRMSFDFPEMITFAEFPDYASKVLMIGAFYAEEVIGDLPCGKPTICFEDGLFEQAFVDNFDELEKWKEYILPLGENEIYFDTVYGQSTLSKKVNKFPVNSMQQALLFDNQDCTLLEPNADGEHCILLDFGKEITGFIGFSVKAEPGTVLDFYMFEHMSEKGMIQNTVDLDNTLRYISRGGWQQYHSVQRRGFRYMMITVRNQIGRVFIRNVYTNMSTYPVTHTGRFLSDNYKLNKIWEMCAYTTKVCMEDTFVDCPAYEQTFWVGDCRNEALVCYYAYGAQQMIRHCLELVWKSAEQSPFLNDQVPSGWLSIIPNWTFLYAIACKEYFQYTGDIEFVEQNLSKVVAPLKAYAKQMTEQGLIFGVGLNLFDWSPMDMPFRGTITSENALYVKALRDIADLAVTLHDRDLERWCIKMADEIADAIARILWSEEKQAFIDCIHEDGMRSEVISQQTNLLVYLADCYLPEQEEALENILMECNPDMVQICTPFASCFYLEALAKMKAYRRITDYIETWWGLMLADDASCTWEYFVWDGHDFPTRSRCHAWSAAPTYFLSAFALGVQINAIKKTILFSPKQCGLKRVSGTVPLVEGSVYVEWTIHNDTMNVYVQAPEHYNVLVEIEKEDFGVKQIELEIEGGSNHELI